MQKVDLFQPLESQHIGPAPYVIRTVVTTTNSYVAGGMPTEAKKIEDYVLLSALPKEIQERVRTAIQTLMSSI
jgi:hypothetical protein